jgi:hypothetical protein
MIRFEMFGIDAMGGMGGPKNDKIGIHFGMKDLPILQRVMWVGLIIHPLVHQE